MPRHTLTLMACTGFILAVLATATVALIALWHLTWFLLWISTTALTL